MIATAAVSPIRSCSLRLPKLAAADVQVLNALHQRRQPWWVPWQGRPLAWSLTSSIAVPLGAGPALQLVLDWEGDTVRLILPGDTPQRLLGVVWPEDPWPSEAVWPPLLWQALFEVLAAAWRRTLPTLRPARIRVVSVREEPVPRAGVLMGWSLSADTDRVAGLVALDAAAAIRLSERLLSVPTRAAGTWSCLSIPLRLIAGWTDLSAAELAATRPGDVLLMDTTCLDADRQGICLALGGGLGLQARRHADGWLINQGVHSVMTEPDSSTHPVPDGLVSLDDLPVRLTFDLGDREVGLGELQALMPGHVFNLGHEIRACVCIRANGRPVGEGDLVDIDGRIGVVVLRILGPDVP